MTTPTNRIPIPGGYQMTLRFSQGGQDAVVVLGASGPTGTANMTTAKAALWRDAFWDNFRTVIVNSVTCVGATVRDVSGPEGTVIEVPAPQTAPGFVSGSAAVASGSTLVKWTSATGGRTGKGRTYVPGLPVTAVQADGRTYTSAHATAVAGAISGYRGAALWDQSFQPAILSFRRGLGRPITGGSLAAVIGTQRRRMR